MKIGVYLIALNEEKHIERCYESARDADVFVLCDTGSTDKTITLAKKMGMQVYEASIKPWRADLSRNVALSLLPKDVDVAISLDLDEVITPGWRNVLERRWEKGTTKLLYPYVQSWLPDGTPGIWYYYDKIHSRFNHHWRHITHEAVYWDGPDGQEKHVTTDEFKVHHFPDLTVQRSARNVLLQAMAREEPHSHRVAWICGRDFLHYGQVDLAVGELKRYLALPESYDVPERTHVLRLLAICYQSQGNMAEAYALRLKACAEAPHLRESWVDLARHYQDVQDWASAYAAAVKAISIAVRPESIFSEPDAWGALPHDILSLAAYHLGLFADACQHCSIALQYEPTSERLKKNAALFQAERDRSK